MYEADEECFHVSCVASRVQYDTRNFDSHEKKEEIEEEEEDGDRDGHKTISLPEY